MARRIIDCTLAGFGLAVAAIPLLVAMVLIKLTSPGPALWRQGRVGRGGRPFHFYKLRTMKTVGVGAQVTAANDPRISAIGRVLRRTKIDELPQLWNIVRGDMSIIGPRPEVPRFVAAYSRSQRAILDVTPGLASLSTLVYAAEAHALRGQADPDAAYIRYVMPLKVETDLHYEQTRTLWSDICLMADLALLIVGWNRRADRQFSIPPGESAPPAQDSARGGTVAI